MSVTDRIDALVLRLQQLALHDSEVEVCWTGASTQQALSTLERALAVRIAGSFRDFVVRTGGGGLDMFRISSVSASDPLSGLGSVYGDTLHWRHHAGGNPLPSNLVVIQRDADDNEPFCLDTSRVVAGENPVVLFYPASRTGYVDRIAPTLIDFYEEYLAPYWNEEDKFS